MWYSVRTTTGASMALRSSTTTAEVVRINNKAVNPADDLDQQDLPDVVAQRIRDLDRRIGALENAPRATRPPRPARSPHGRNRKGPCTFYPDRIRESKNKGSSSAREGLPLFILPSAPAPWTR